MATTLTANATALPEPSSILNNMYMIGDSKRNAAGAMNIQFIVNKRKYNVKWGTMTPAALLAMVAIIKPTLALGTAYLGFTLIILDPGVAGGSYTGTFYAGDITYDNVKIDAYGVVTFKEVKCDLIEM